MNAIEVATNKGAVNRLRDAVNSGDIDAISRTFDELVAADAVISTALPLEATGAQLLKEVFAMLLQAYPDLRIVVEDMIAEGDKVVARNTVTGTHRGSYMGIPPTGESVTYDEVFILRFAGGQIVQMWGLVDVLAQLRQLGAIPGPAAA